MKQEWYLWMDTMKEAAALLKILLPAKENMYLEWPCWSPDLNPIELRLHNPKQAVHARKSTTTQLTETVFKVYLHFCIQILTTLYLLHVPILDLQKQ